MLSALGFPLPSQAQTVSQSSTNDTSLSVIAVLSGYTSWDEIQLLTQSIEAQLVGLNIQLTFLYPDNLPADSPGQDAWISSYMGNGNAGLAFAVTQTDTAVSLRILRRTPQGIEVTVRPVDTTSGAPRHEALSVIIHATVISFLEQQPLAPSPSDALETAAKQAPPAPQPLQPVQPPEIKKEAAHKDILRLWIRSAFATGFFSQNTAPWVGGIIGVGWSLTPNIYIHADYILFSKVTKDTGTLSLTLFRHPIYLGVGLIQPFEHFYWGGGLALFLDHVTEKVVSHSEHVAPDSNGYERTVGVFVHIETGVCLRPWLRLFFAPGIEIPLSRTNYSIKEFGEEKQFVGPFVVQPTFRLGVRIDFF